MKASSHGVTQGLTIKLSATKNAVDLTTRRTTPTKRTTPNKKII